MNQQNQIQVGNMVYGRMLTADKSVTQVQWRRIYHKFCTHSITRIC